MIVLADIFHLPGILKLPKQYLYAGQEAAVRTGHGTTHKEKLATYLRYLAECPTYCHDNAWCYSFFNCGGCVNCPFPCANQDKYYKKLHEKFIAEQKKANSKEKKWDEYIDAWADEYNQAQKEIKEYYVTRTARS